MLTTSILWSRGYTGLAARLYQWTEKLVWYENDTITEFQSFIIPFIAIPFLTLLVVILAKWKTKSIIKKFQSSLLYYCPQDFEAQRT
jgi:Na+/alanine symporter